MKFLILVTGHGHAFIYVLKTSKYIPDIWSTSSITIYGPEFPNAKNVICSLIKTAANLIFLSYTRHVSERTILTMPIKGLS